MTKARRRIFNTHFLYILSAFILLKLFDAYVYIINSYSKTVYNLNMSKCKLNAG